MAVPKTSFMGGVLNEDKFIILKEFYQIQTKISKRDEAYFYTQKIKYYFLNIW